MRRILGLRHESINRYPGFEKEASTIGMVELSDGGIPSSCFTSRECWNSKEKVMGFPGSHSYPKTSPTQSPNYNTDHLVSWTVDINFDAQTK